MSRGIFCKLQDQAPVLCHVRALFFRANHNANGCGDATEVVFLGRLEKSAAAAPRPACLPSLRRACSSPSLASLLCWRTLSSVGPAWAKRSSAWPSLQHSLPQQPGCSNSISWSACRRFSSQSKMGSSICSRDQHAELQLGNMRGFRWQRYRGIAQPAAEAHCSIYTAARVPGLSCVEPCLSSIS